MKKLLAICLMLITGLTQAQTFSFNCEPDGIGVELKPTEVAVTFIIGHGADNYTESVTVSSSTVLEGDATDIYVIDFTLPNSLKFDGLQQGSANVSSTGLSWQYSYTSGLAAGAVVVDADFVSDGVKREVTVDISEFIAYDEVDFKLEFQFANGVSVYQSETIISTSQPASFTLSFDIPDGYEIAFSSPNGYSIPKWNNGFKADVQPFKKNNAEEWIDVVITVPSDVDYDNGTINHILGLSGFFKLTPPKAMFITTLNGVEQDPLEDNGYEEYIIIDGSENYQGSIEVTIDGTPYEVEHPGNAWSKQIGDTQFSVVIYGPTAPAGEEYKLNSWRIAHNPVGDEDATHAVNWEKIVEEVDPPFIPGIDGFIIDKAMIPPAEVASQVVIQWNFPGANTDYQDVVIHNKESNTYKGKFTLPAGFSTKDIQATQSSNGTSPYALDLEAADGYGDDTYNVVEWRFHNKGYDTSDEIIINIHPLTHWEWFYGFEQTHEVVSSTNSTTQFNITWDLGSETVSSSDSYIDNNQLNLTELNLGDYALIYQMVEYQEDIPGGTLHITNSVVGAKHRSDSIIRVYIIFDADFDTSGANDINFNINIADIIDEP